jgi:hypothetical protein
LKRWSLAFLMAVAVAVCGCAAGPNPLMHTAGVHGVAGFWKGLWQGMICPIVFVISLFYHNVSIYEVHNSGAWYNAGFIFGAGAWGVLGRGRSSRGSR